MGNGPSLTATYRAMLDANFGLTILVLDFPRSDRCVDNGCETSLEAAITAQKAGGGRFAIVTSLPENMTEAHAERLLAVGIAPMMGLATALTAAANAAWIGEVWSRPQTAMLARQPSASAVDAVAMDEWSSKSVLREIGVMTPQGGVVASADDAVALADKLGYPVVLKGWVRRCFTKPKWLRSASICRMPRTFEPPPTRLPILNAIFWSRKWSGTELRN